MTQYGGGTLRFAGTVNEPATVTIQGQPATVSASGAFAGGASVATGTNLVAIQATDAAGNTATASYQVPVGANAKTFTFDANGNLLADGLRQFEWNGRNHLSAIVDGDRRIESSYNGLQREALWAEKVSGVVESENVTVWCEGDRPVGSLQRDSEGSVAIGRSHQILRSPGIERTTPRWAVG